MTTHVAWDNLRKAMAYIIAVHVPIVGMSILPLFTSDWPLDRFGCGDISVQVPPGRWSEAEEALGDYDL